MRPFTFAMAVVLSAGCYTYEPVPLVPAPAPGADLRLSITDRGTVDLRDYLGPNVERLNGQLVAADSSEVNLAVRSVVMYNGSEQFWTGDRIRIPRSAVAQAEVRRFSASRTGFLAALAIGGAIMLADALLGGGDAAGEGRPIPIPPGQ
ncbi:MAG TPA: hypothetical protein VK922_11300 [Gemmatimonadaceae bacterium]|nr:hypothetical protein [Gemmatimonadaceae bacterium]